MFLIILLVIVFAIGFGCGYGVRELMSRRRRAAERKNVLRRKEQKRYDESKSQIPTHGLKRSGTYSRLRQRGNRRYFLTLGQSPTCSLDSPWYATPNDACSRLQVALKIFIARTNTVTLADIQISRKIFLVVVFILCVLTFATVDARHANGTPVHETLQWVGLVAIIICIFGRTWASLYVA